ncbi:NAD(P)-binding protein [Venustampulla echinocandica]|uniref:NAD(P)-binding protein n=1 Tax=Venustampulla echinocandica TaxID=2656787 RepID=A0A370TT59_9HELO|nr:NAD(P)-binding protein [Venustampulla echinocandica]RDL38719.1 NAD(P)-binding protein [Venustampulla echinocandica]
MHAQQASNIFVIGGTGAQGIPVVQALVEDKQYRCRILTRDTASARSQSLLALGNVELVQGTFANEDDLRKGMRGCDGAFINIDGFSSGEKAEVFWAIRSYEIAIQEGIKFYVYANIDYATKKSGYDPKFRAGHLDGKGRIGEWVMFQNQDNKERMGAALFTTGPYIDMVISTPIMAPTVEDGIATWRAPLGDGAVCHVALEDCGYYVRWLFDHPERANGMNLDVAVADITYTELAAAFERVTGHPARYIDTDLDTYWNMPVRKETAGKVVGYNADPNDPSLMKNRENFTGLWNVSKYRLLKKDYKKMDEIHPNRIKSAEEWFRMEDKKGREEGKGSLWERIQAQSWIPILKDHEDSGKGSL